VKASTMVCRLAAVVMAVVAGLAGSVRAAEDPAALRDEAFQAAQWALTTSASQALAQMGARFASGDDALATLVRQRQDLVETWRIKDEALLGALGRGDADSQAQSASLRTELSGISEQISGLDAELGARFPEYAELSNPKPLTIADVQGLLRDGEALLLFLVTVEDSYVWAVSRDKSSWTRVGIGAEALAEQVKKLRATLDPSGSLRAAESAFGEEIAEGGVPFDRTTAHELYKSYLAPLADVLDGQQSLLVVADGAFTSLPLSVLVTEPPEGDDADPDALRSTVWLMKTTALTTLPAVSSLKALRVFQHRGEASEPFRGFGSPTLVGRAGAGGGEDVEVADAGGVRAANAYFRGRYADVDAVRELEPLPATENELRRMADALGADPAVALALGDAATETAVKSASLEGAKVLAFATHGLLTGELKGLAEPALVFTPPSEATDIDDGLLTASEAAQLKLGADWVVLSACNTAAGDGTPGAEGLSGLARAFLYAGARAILVSHWPVRDDAAAALTTNAFAKLTEDPSVGRAEALREAMIAVMENTDDPTLAHPSAWAPFVVVGEGGAGL
jgi:CHAT domain-containing protein